MVRRDIQFCERLADEMGKRTMWELESWDDEEWAEDIMQMQIYTVRGHGLGCERGGGMSLELGKVTAGRKTGKKEVKESERRG